jgi:Lipopolysaccharide kinase (Kdo/WaaP) family
MLTRLWWRLVHGEWRVRQEPHWASFAGPDWLDRIMSVGVTDRLFVKQGRSIGRLILHDGDERLVVYLKRHYRLPWLRGLLAVLFPSMSWSPAFEEWDNLALLRAEGFPVPRVAAAGQLLLSGARLQSFLAVEELTGMLALHEAIPLARRRLSPVEFAAWKRGLIGALATLCRSLHDRGYYHKDLYLCHFYLREADTLGIPPSWDERLVMIDLHRLGRHRLTGWWWLAKDLGQLLYSSAIEGVTARDRLRFWRRYHGDRRRSLLRRWVRRLVETRAWNYSDRNRRKPQVPRGA